MDEKQPSAEARALWTDLCELPDRTSPPDYPDMALIAEAEFYAYLSAFAARSRWQPIRLAPRQEHSRIDLWISHSPDRAHLDGREADCAWVDGAWRRWSDKIDEWVEVEQLTPLRDGGWWRACHWQPLPSPPEPPSCP